ncbi:MAG: formylglycine-generating enzyme family protein [Pirellulaceae bacterium]|nr:formylglycine-generating enzyme family protein [Pirellulaceae bacterium]
MYVPPGEFEMGDGESDDCPKHRVWLDGYYIGVFAVTNAQYQRFVRATGHRAPNNNRWQDKSFSDHPVTDVSWEDASEYVQWSGLRLPSEAEWEKSARGPGNWKYPWGDAWDAQRCRNAENKGSETTCPVYGYGTGVSGYGCYNASGNVWEWCADWYESGYYRASPSRNPRGPEGGSDRVRRGGSWYSDASNCRAAYRDWYEPGYRDVDLGFRPAR